MSDPFLNIRDDTMKYIVQFGAGNIGRSLVGSVFSEAGYEIIFIDAQPEIIHALNSDKQYRILIKDNDHPDGVEKIIHHVGGVLASDTASVAQAVAGADYVCTAVGARILPLIMPSIAQGLQLRTEPLSVILCENLHNASKVAGTYLDDALSGHNPAPAISFVETSIGKMVPIMPEEIRKQSPLEVWAEPYNTIIADRNAFIGEAPAIDGLSLKTDFNAWVERKLYVHNLGHAACAWHGYQHGKKMIWQCLEDPWIHAEARAAMNESAQGLVRKYPEIFSQPQMQEHIDDLLYRFGNRALGDTVFRVGRDLSRKLSASDRTIGALRLCTKQGVDPEHICRTIAAAFSFRATDEGGAQFPADIEILNSIDKDGIWPVLVDTCGLSPRADGGVLERIISRYTALCPA